MCNVKYSDNAMPSKQMIWKNWLKCQCNLKLIICLLSYALNIIV